MTGPIAIRRNSVLFYAEGNVFPSPVMVKVCLNPSTGEADGEAAIAQYDAAVRVYTAMQRSSTFSVPRPYLVQPDAGLLVMEWISGSSVGHLLSSLRCSAATGVESVIRCARWLRHFHECHVLPASHLDVSERLRRLDHLEVHVPDRVFRHGLDQLRLAADAAAQMSLPRSWIHGDFKADNVILSGSRTLGIDVHLRRENAVVYDLASFLNNLAVTRYEPSGWSLARSYTRLRSAFLSAYAGASSECLMLPVAWVQLFMLLQQWHSSRGRTGRFRMAFVDYCHRRITCDLVQLITTSRRYRGAVNLTETDASTDLRTVMGDSR
jgi:tRNA A-37 threonylcarbamoyl transferase component Bud32